RGPSQAQPPPGACDHLPPPGAGSARPACAFLRRFRRAAGPGQLRVEVTVVDSGGAHTEQVYRFTRPRIGRRIFPIKSRLLIQTPGPGFAHLPDWVDEEYVAQLTAET